jgi:hypothetical protein
MTGYEFLEYKTNLLQSFLKEILPQELESSLLKEEWETKLWTFESTKEMRRKDSLLNKRGEK